MRLGLLQCSWNASGRSASSTANALNALPRPMWGSQRSKSVPKGVVYSTTIAKVSHFYRSYRSLRNAVVADCAAASWEL